MKKLLASAKAPARQSCAALMTLGLTAISLASGWAVARGLAAPAQTTRAAPQQHSAPIGIPHKAFRSVLSELVGHTSVPVILPAWMPPGVTARYTSAGAIKDSYFVDMPDELEYRYKLPHSWHAVEAQRVKGGQTLFPGIPVALSGGRTGYYTSGQENSGARPGDAWVSWKQDGCEYLVSEHVGDRATVMRMANSAVLVGAVPRSKKAARGAPTLPAGVPNAAFRGVLALMLRQCDVPVVLPTYLPDWPGGYYISLGNNERNGWPVIFQARLDGGPEDDASDVGSFDGEKVGPHMEGSEGVPVRLTGGRTGYYWNYATRRHAHDTGQLWWEQGGVRYTMQWQGGSRRTLVRMADSVVRARMAPGWPSAAAIGRYWDEHADPKSGFHYSYRYGAKIGPDHHEVLGERKTTR